MTQVDFYILQDTAPQERYRLACRIIDKAYGLGHRIHIHADSLELLQQLDDLLWTFRDRSFIPHEIDPDEPDSVPVTLGNQWLPEHADVLVNLANEVPESFSRFERVVEIITQEGENRESGRARYRFYRERGYTPTHHQIKS
jgi:DNA polymerase-3 subunit chi